MQSKFEQLLEKLNISLECKNVLYNCELKKIVSNDELKSLYEIIWLEAGS